MKPPGPVKTPGWGGFDYLETDSYEMLFSIFIRAS
ncbi:MAG: hypothetical protein K0R23_575 [Lacrimispora sp.]|jgi:hypothetical protein|nr:hypothetical protein [Lacrimispora sp.]